MHHRAQLAQLAFVLITLGQIAVFLFTPEYYERVAQGLEGAPHFAAFRLIAIKELGLMSLYTMGIYLNESKLTYMTCFGRLTVLLFTPIMIYYYGAPHALWGGVVQDVGSSALTLYFLRADPSRIRSKRVVALSAQEQILPQICVFGAGVLELWNAYLLFCNPKHTDLFQPVFGEGVGMRAFAFMSMVIGAYQIALSTWYAQGLDGLVYLILALHHGMFYLLCRYGLPLLVGEQFSPPQFHQTSAMAIAGAVVVGKALSFV